MNETEIKKLMEEVRLELDVVLKSEQSKLSKAHPGEESEAEVSPDKSATDAGDSKGSPPESASPAPDDSAPPAADAAPPAPAPDASAPVDAAPVDPAASAPMDPAALQAEYAGLPIEELKMHVLASKAAYFAAMGASDPAMSADPAASAAPPSPPAAAPPVASPPAAPPALPPAMKAEMKDEEANGGEMKKSEKDLRIEELEKSLASLESMIPGLIKVVENAVAVPPRKGITSVAQLAPSVGDLSKSEIDTRLMRVIKSKDVSEDDRSLINAYGFGRIGVEGIKHLLVK